MFEAASFFACFFGGHAEDIVKELEKQDMPGINASRGNFSRFGQADGFALNIGEVTEIGEPLEGRGNGGRFYGTCSCDIAYTRFI